jgi:hypothetical protein
MYYLEQKLRWMPSNSLNNDKKAEPIEVKRTTNIQIVSEPIAEKLQQNYGF